MFTINHVGLAVPNIKRYLKSNSFLYEGFSQTDVIENTTQKVREVFLSDGNTTIELLEPMGPDSPLDAFLKNHLMGGLVHICFNCQNIQEAISKLCGSGAKLISGPTPDIAFNSSPIAFLFLSGQVIELVQQ